MDVFFTFYTQKYNMGLNKQLYVQFRVKKALLKDS